MRNEAEGMSGDEYIVLHKGLGFIEWIMAFVKRVGVNIEVVGASDTYIGL